MKKLFLFKKGFFPKLRILPMFPFNITFILEIESMTIDICSDQ